MAGVDFYVVLQVVLFIFCVWATGRLFKACRLAAMLGYLLCGILMGPAFFDVVPYASSGTCDTIVTRRLAEAAANLLTNPQLDPYGKIPEFKFCAAKVEAAERKAAE